MPSLNEVRLAGHLGRDPELKFTKNNTAVCQFSLAATRKWKDGNDWKEETYWAGCVAWSRDAEAIAKCRKGDAVYVEGYLKREEWEANGQKKEATRVVVRRWFKIDYERKQQAASAPAGQQSFIDNETTGDQIPF